MQYMLLIYQNEAAMQRATRAADVGELMGAYGAYTKAMIDAGVFVAGDPLRPLRDGDHGPRRKRQDQGAERPLCRDQGAARRLLHHRRAGPRRRAVAGPRAAPGAQTGVMEVRGRS